MFRGGGRGTANLGSDDFNEQCAPRLRFYTRRGSCVETFHADVLVVAADLPVGIVGAGIVGLAVAGSLLVPGCR